MTFKRPMILLMVLLWGTTVHSQPHSIAREWNEILLEAIRNDFARPTVHARNLFHISAAMYDAWAIYDEQASTYFLNQSHRGFYIPFDQAAISETSDKVKARHKAISYAAYRLIEHRFQNAPEFDRILLSIRRIMTRYNYKIEMTSTDYSSEDNAAAVGNYIAEQIIAFGLMDGSNEAEGYANRQYQPVNGPLFPNRTGPGGLKDPNRWQPLSFEDIEFVDQSGQILSTSTPPFLGAEWGLLVPFSLTDEDMDVKYRNGQEYWVYHDPGPPAYLDTSIAETVLQDYAWNFSLVAQWSSHMDPTDGVMWDISPASIGNIPYSAYPKTISELPNFYQLEEGGDISPGYELNPKTNQPYTPQIVPRGDYARVLAEFWADGPDSETPPGHWFTILNYVHDHPDFSPRYQGEGEDLELLEWDVKAYFLLGGAMHDVAITSWSIKGYYDYIRPISAIRGMAAKGQSSDKSLPHYDPAGIPLFPGFIELVQEGDACCLPQEDKIKVRAWKEAFLYEDVDTTFWIGGGVEWIPAGLWVPYQRPSFVTPPFAGYVSGHSTYSRAAARVLSLLTGDEYFPGGMGEFVAAKNDFLVFEEGPSQDVVLQWAKYTDASDQCSFSRIWGGIHPPVDDIRGRLIGEEIGQEAFAFANLYFQGAVSPAIPPEKTRRYSVGPNPALRGESLHFYTEQYDELSKKLYLFNSNGQKVLSIPFHYVSELSIDTYALKPGLYFGVIDSPDYRESFKVTIR